MLKFKLNFLRLSLKQKGWSSLSTLLNVLPIDHRGLFGLGAPHWYFKADSYLNNKWWKVQDEIWVLLDS